MTDNIISIFFDNTEKICMLVYYQALLTFKEYHVSTETLQMKGRGESHLCIPRNETVQPPYFQNRIIL
jgi:hypothetical protein